MRVILQQPVQCVHGGFPFSKPAILLPTAAHTDHVLLLQQCLASITGLSPGWHTHGHSQGVTDLEFDYTLNESGNFELVQ